MPHTTITAHVLLVDDQPANLLALEAALDSLGVDMVRAQSGPQALAALEKQDFAAVLLDVRMPGMDGLEAARHLNVLEEPPAVIFTTAFDQYAVEAFEAALDELSRRNAQAYVAAVERNLARARDVLAQNLREHRDQDP